MKFLLTCPNSENSLMGYDWDKNEIFWSVSSQVIRVCSACYNGNDLVVSSDNFVTRFAADGYYRIELRGKYDSLCHSIRVMDGNVLGVVDSGNSQVVALAKQGEVTAIFRPLEFWEDYPLDAIHLNDFAATPTGILASSFGYRPWRKVSTSMPWERWASSGYGLVLNLTGKDGKGNGRIVGCGFNQPHSLHFESPNRLFLCSSGTGIFHMCHLNDEGLVTERKNFQITSDHFLRGACRVDDGLFLGGSPYCKRC